MILVANLTVPSMQEQAGSCPVTPVRLFFWDSLIQGPLAAVAALAVDLRTATLNLFRTGSSPSASAALPLCIPSARHHLHPPAYLCTIAQYAIRHMTA